MKKRDKISWFGTELSISHIQRGVDKTWRETNRDRIKHALTYPYTGLKRD